MVITIEPGIYIPEENLGVRIEDDVLITESGHKLLSERLPRDPAEIEKIMAAGFKLRSKESKRADDDWPPGTRAFILVFRVGRFFLPACLESFRMQLGSWPP